MTAWLRPWWVLALSLAAGHALALPGNFAIDQVYSSADGSVQFIVIRDHGSTDCDAQENRWAGQLLIATGPAPARTFVFPTDLPTCKTSGKRMLIATQGFAGLGLVTPDFVIPNGFLQIPQGHVNFADVSFISYTALPDDGVHAIDGLGHVVGNLATNLAGASASVVPGTPRLNYQGLFYNAPAESEAGWGINFAHQGDVVFASWFTYDTTGRAWWLTMTADKVGDGVYAGALYETRGPAFSTVPFDATAVTAAAVGNGTLTFADVDHATFHYVVNGVDQTKSIVRQVFGPVPSCAWGAQPDLSLATNVQDLWWAAPAGAEAGWGVNFTHQGDTIFATWFTYDVDGKPLWLSATATKSAPGHYAGLVYRTTGPAFSAVPWDRTHVTVTSVGSLALDFADGNHATFHYVLTVAPASPSVDQTKAVTRQVFKVPGTVCTAAS
jgi:hypothetical protein